LSESEATVRRAPGATTATFPSPWLALVFVLPSLLSLGLLYAPELSWVVFGLDGCLLVLAMVDRLLLGRAPLSVTRDYRDVFSVGKPNPVDLLLDWTGNRSIDVAVRSDLPLGTRCAEFPLRVRLTPGRPARVRHHLVPDERGSEVLGDHFVRYSSRLGFWVRQVRLHARDPVRVYPDLATIRSYELLARKHRQYALVRASALRGGESEFARLRDYTSDDDYRFVDWKATARRGKLTAREHQLESDQNVILVLDAGRLMTAVVDGFSQFDHALNASLLMAHVACRGGDRVGLLCFDEEVRVFVPPQGGPKTTHRITRASYALKPTLTDSAFARGFLPLLERVKQRSLFVVFTQLLDDSAARELSEQLRLLSRKHIALVVVLEDTDMLQRIHAPNRTPSRRDLYQKGALAELLSWKAQALAALRNTGALVIETPSRDLTPQLINRYLELKVRRSL